MFVNAVADVLKDIRSCHDKTSKWKDSGVNKTGTPNAVATDNSTFDDDNKGTSEKESFCISPNPFDQN